MSNVIQIKAKHSYNSYAVTNNEHYTASLRSIESMLSLLNKIGYKL
jgi:hypothetical protein